MIRIKRAGRFAAVRRTAGFSMIEVLVSLLVLALGLLGFALLQTMNLRYTQSADYRTHATNLAYELLDQMRANRLSAADYESATFTAGNGGTNCSRPIGIQVTIPDVIERWQCQVVETLGAEASATVEFNPATPPSPTGPPAPPSGLVSITLTWGERITTDPQTSFMVETHL